LGMLALLKNETIYQYFVAMSEETDDETSLLWFSNMERVVGNCFDDPGVESTLPHDQLVKVQEALQKRMDAQRSLVKLIRWKLFSKDKFLIRRVLVANGLPENRKAMKILERRIDNRLNLEHHLTSIRQKPWLVDMPTTYNESEVRTWFTRQKLAMRAKLLFNTLREIRKAISPKRVTREDFITLVKKCLTIVNEIPERSKPWLEWLTAYQIRNLIHEPSLEQEYIKTLRRDFDSLCDFDRLKESLLPYERDVINRLYEKVGWDAEKQMVLFEN